MRDPARIDKVLGLIRSIWKANPELRLGQLLMTAASKTQAAQTLQNPCPEVFYMEDDLLLQKLKEMNKDSHSS